MEGAAAESPQERLHAPLRASRLRLRMDGLPARWGGFLIWISAARRDIVSERPQARFRGTVLVHAHHPYTWGSQSVTVPEIFPGHRRR